jgi:ubiquinone/menaquinone biosynthesis C-methylase UbiE
LTTSNRDYYDAFAEGYDERRGGGYHKLIDDQAAELVRRVGTSGELLDVGCGTGLILERVTRFARHARGVDLSPGMLDRARARGLDVSEADAATLPFDDATFDVAYSFKVLSHVGDLRACLREMARVVRPGGHLVFDVYNRWSLRYLIKRTVQPGRTSRRFRENAIETRFLSPAEASAFFPDGSRLLSRAGIRIVTLHPGMLRVWGMRRAVAWLEWRLMDTLLSRYAGFAVFTLKLED